MKRTNLVLDGALLEEAVRLSGQRTYSAAVTLALEEFVRRVKAGQILDLAGSGLWEGDLAAMRSDLPVPGTGSGRAPGCYIGVDRGLPKAHRTLPSITL